MKKFRDCFNPEQDGGNMLIGVTDVYTWDTENRLIMASNSFAHVAVIFQYDHHSRRISKTVLNSSLIIHL